MDDDSQFWREHDRRESERLEIKKLHARRDRKQFFRQLPRNILLITAAVGVIWAVKACESKNHAADPDRTGIKGQSY